MRLTYAFSTAVIGLGLTAAASASAAAIPGPLRQVSGGSPFADCTKDMPPGQAGLNYAGSEVEPWVDVDPLDPDHMVGTWQQDRWSNGAARGLGVGVSFDGGDSWTPLMVPGLSRCTGGNFLRVSDPWLSFGADGVLHHIGLATNPTSSQATAMLATRSADGGLTWSEPIRLIINTLPFLNDKEALTADPTDARYVYAAWDRLDYSRNRGPAFFVRTTDGGLSWQAARNVHDPGFSNQVLGAQVAVLPDGEVLLFFTEIFNTFQGQVTLASFKRSINRGDTFTPASPGAFRPFEMRTLPARDPALGLPVRDGALLLDVAVDPVRGWLYLVWQDGSRSGFAWPDILLSASFDRGATWSAPARVNATPLQGPPARRQAFTASVHVLANGTVGVSYYDFRLDDDAPGAAADHWLAWCHPLASDCTADSGWRHEVRLTDVSFDLLQAPFARGLFLGDYVGLAGAGDAFIAFFTQPHDLDLASAFARRVEMAPSLHPAGAGYWSQQARVAAGAPGRARELPEDLAAWLGDVRVLYDLFDGVTDAAALAAVLDPPRPPDMRARAARELMALLLNISADRLSPWIEVAGGGEVAAVARELAAVVSDAGATRRQLEAAKDRAAALNDGDLLR